MGRAAVGPRSPLSRRAAAAYEKLLIGELDGCPPEIEAELLRAGVLTDGTDSSAIFPEEALATLLRERIPQCFSDAADLSALALQLITLARHRARHDLDPELRLEFLPESSQRRQAQRMLLSGVMDDLLVVNGESVADWLPVHTPPDDTPSPPAGVRWRAVIATGAIQQPELGQAHAAAGRESGVVVRTHPSIPLWAVVVDDDAALISTGPDLRSGALLIRIPAMVTMIRGWAEALWNEAVDVVPPERRRASDPLGPDVHLLLDLITAGYTDQAMARALRLSPRTVRRRIDRLRELLGVRNRHQLLLAAREQGWQPRPPSPFAGLPRDQDRRPRPSGPGQPQLPPPALRTAR